MKKIILLAIVFFGLAAYVKADHGPRIQVIHNATAESVSSVDVWFNYSNFSSVWAPTKLTNYFSYKEATIFTTYTLVYGDVVFYVTPAGSTDTSEIIFKKSFGQPEIDYEESYVVVLSGDAEDNLDIILNEGKEEAEIPSKTSLSIFHGSFDAPEVNIVEISIPAGPIVNNLEYMESSGYLNLEASDYILQVQTTDGIGVADFAVPLSSFAGSALFVAATGYLDTTGATPNEAFKLLAVTPDGNVQEIEANQEITTARVQVIHNSADAAAAVVDVWLDDNLLLDNFEFRTASPFIDAPGDEEFTISIKGPDSNSPDDPIWSEDYILASGETYILVAEGIVSPVGYDPATPFDIAVYDMGREAANLSGDTDILVHHGSTDAPTIDVVEISVPYNTIVDDISYGEFDGYIEIPTTNLVLNLFEPVNGTFATYDAPLSDLGLDGEAITIVASGFLNPENNSNGEAFGLWVAVADGGELIELPVIPQTPYGWFQLIHNSADAEAAIVDVWIDDALAYDNLPFRFATPLNGMPADVEFTVSITGPNSQNPDNPIWSNSYILEEDSQHIMVAEGIVSSSGYDPLVPFDVAVYDMGRVYSNMPENTDILVHHGSTDAPTVDIYEVGVGAGLIVDNLMYGDYAGYLELETQDYVLEIRDETGTNTIATYGVPLETFGLNGVALTVMASGFLDPTNNSNGPAFGLWVAPPSGGPLVELPAQSLPETARVQVIHNSADEAAEVVDVWLDDQLLLDDFQFRTASPFIDAPAGEEFTIAIKGSASQNPDNPIWSQKYTLEADKKYILVANGIVSETGYDPFEPFDIYVYDMAREEAAMTENTDLLVFHGSTDAPVVDIVETGVGAGTVIDNLSYGDFRGYLDLQTADYYLSIRDESGNNELASYSAPLESLGLQAEALVVVASGFLNPDNNSGGEAFGLWVALPSGGSLIELMNVTSVEENLIEEASVEIYPNPVSELVNISFSLTKESEVNVFIYDLLGRLEKSASFGTAQKAVNNRSLNISDLENGLYILSVQAGSSVVNSKIQIFK